jgi:hypothetical protein
LSAVTVNAQRLDIDAKVKLVLPTVISSAWTAPAAR